MSDEKKNKDDKSIVDDQNLIRQMEQAAKLLEKYNLTDIEAEMGAIRFKVSRRIMQQRVVHTPSFLPPNAAGGTLVQDTSAPSLVPPPAPSLKDNPNVVTSPMVGTVYLAPEPGAKPFVAAGTAVRKNQTLLIVEAMKTMNNVQAPRDGVVKEVLVKNAEPVEYGDPLVILE